MARDAGIHLFLMNNSRLISVLPVEMFVTTAAPCPNTRTYMILPSNTAIRLDSVEIRLTGLGALDYLQQKQNPGKGSPPWKVLEALKSLLRGKFPRCSLSEVNCHFAGSERCKL